MRGLPESRTLDRIEDMDYKLLVKLEEALWLIQKNFGLDMDEIGLLAILLKIEHALKNKIKD